MPGKPSDRDTIVRVKECHNLGLKAHEIAQRCDLSKSTVKRVVAKFKAGDDEVPTHSHSIGRPKKYSPRTIRMLKKEVEIRPWLTAKRLKEENPELLGDSCDRTIQRCLSTKDLQYKNGPAKRKPLMTARHLKNRIAFCKLHLEWPLEEIRKVMFTDEATFYISDLF